MARKYARANDGTVRDGAYRSVGLLASVAIALVTVGSCADRTVSGVAASSDRSAPSNVSVPVTAAPTATESATTPARDCTVRDLVAEVREGNEGTGGHLLSVLDFRNIGQTRCILSGYPTRVSLSEPGHQPLVATEGTFFPVPTSEPMDPGEVTALGIQTDSTCVARPTGGPPGPMYHDVSIELRGGVVRVAIPGGLDVRCGASITTFTRWQ